jgi:hypothetical protein
VINIELSILIMGINNPNIWIINLKESPVCDDLWSMNKGQVIKNGQYYPKEEIARVMKMLFANHWTISETSSQLKIRRCTISGWMKKYNLSQLTDADEVEAVIIAYEKERKRISPPSYVSESLKKRISLEDKMPVIVSAPHVLKIQLPQAGDIEVEDDKNRNLLSYIADLKTVMATRMKILVAEEKDLLKIAQSMKILNDIEISWTNGGVNPALQQTNFIQIITKQLEDRGNELKNQYNGLQGNRIDGDNTEPAG